MPPMQLGVVQFRRRHHSSLGVRNSFLVAFEEGEDHGDELASDAADYFPLAMILPRALVVGAFAWHEPRIQARELIIRSPQGLPDSQVEDALER
jgi:hypothetical protein